eukprot:3277264-Prymnesium_polylepis.1
MESLAMISGNHQRRVLKAPCLGQQPVHRFDVSIGTAHEAEKLADVLLGSLGAGLARKARQHIAPRRETAAAILGLVVGRVRVQSEQVKKEALVLFGAPAQIPLHRTEALGIVVPQPIVARELRKPRVRRGGPHLVESKLGLVANGTRRVEG